VRPHLVRWLDAVLPPAIAQPVAPSWFTCVGLVTLFLMLASARASTTPELP